MSSIVYNETYVNRFISRAVADGRLCPARHARPRAAERLRHCPPAAHHAGFLLAGAPQPDLSRTRQARGTRLGDACPRRAARAARQEDLLDYASRPRSARTLGRVATAAESSSRRVGAEDVLTLACRAPASPG